LEKSLTVREDVASAIAAGQPVVALESTVIAHGLPRPLNLQTARAMEAAVREAGATPATVGVLNGQLVVGLSPEQIAFLSEAESVAKVSRADLAAVLAFGGPGCNDGCGNDDRRGDGGNTRLRYGWNWRRASAVAKILWIFPQT